MSSKFWYRGLIAIGVVVLLIVSALTTHVQAEDSTSTVVPTLSPTETDVPLPTGVPVSLLRATDNNSQMCWMVQDQGFDAGLFVSCNEGIGNLTAIDGYLFQGECYTPNSGISFYLHPFATNGTSMVVHSATDGETVYVKFTEGLNSTTWTALGPVTTCVEATAEPTAEATPQS